MIRQARQHGHLAVIFIDLDHFKPVNDTYGHHAGDQLLTAVAANLRSSVRSTDLPSRYGGDEFLVICEGLTEPEDTTILAQRLLAKLPGTYTLPADSSRPATSMSHRPSSTSPNDVQPRTGDESRPVVVNIGASIGIAVVTGAVQAGALLRAADEAMYAAKQAGGNCHRIRIVPTPDET